MSPDLVIRPMETADMERALDWAAEEGWNPGLEDATAFRKCDPDGFFVGESNGTPVSCISAVRYGDDFGFIGFYICHPDWRGQGLARPLWDRALDHLEGRTIGLDAVLAQEETYRLTGFESDYHTLRHGGLSVASPPMDPRVAVLGQGVMPSVLAYDRPFFATERERFLKNWCAPMVPGRRGYVFVEEGNLRGYGVIRRCREGFKIGPLLADTPEVADTLFQALAGEVRGQMVFLDVPAANEAGLDIAETYELSPEFETVRMYRGPAPELDLARTYGITTLELG
jgi:GNAT superfamily N-acetyltransferase